MALSWDWKDRKKDKRVVVIVVIIITIIIFIVVTTIIIIIIKLNKRETSSFGMWHVHLMLHVLRYYFKIIIHSLQS